LVIFPPSATRIPGTVQNQLNIRPFDAWLAPAAGLSYGLMTDQFTGWLEALDRRHLADLTPSEVARALRALSSCYVERRERLARGGALESAGKRAAFALFYAPLHFLAVREIVRASADALPAGRIARILDLGCGTGAAGAAWALENGGCTIDAADRHAWAVAEANWTYRALGLTGRARQSDVDRLALRGEHGQAILAAYTVNELPDATRDRLLPRLIDAHAGGARILIVEPIARRMSGWWTAWESAFAAAGGTAHEWRFATPLPERQRQLGRAAGLDPRELTARSLLL
jgi:SAM-dependent methyltransferase